MYPDRGVHHFFRFGLFYLLRADDSPRLWQWTVVHREREYG